MVLADFARLVWTRSGISTYATRQHLLKICQAAVSCTSTLIDHQSCRYELFLEPGPPPSSPKKKHVPGTSCDITACRLCPQKLQGTARIVPPWFILTPLEQSLMVCNVVSFHIRACHFVDRMGEKAIEPRPICIPKDACRMSHLARIEHPQCGKRWVIHQNPKYNLHATTIRVPHKQIRCHSYAVGH